METRRDPTIFPKLHVRRILHLQASNVIGKKAGMGRRAVRSFYSATGILPVTVPNIPDGAGSFNNNNTNTLGEHPQTRLWVLAVAHCYFE